MKLFIDCSPEELRGLIRLTSFNPDVPGLSTRLEQARLMKRGPYLGFAEHLHRIKEHTMLAFARGHMGSREMLA